MPEQILLQGKILGTEEFLLAGPAEGRSVRSAGEDLLAGKSQWITLLCEVLPRALLAELGLARILLGSSGGGQFLVVLPGNVREAAETFLTAAAEQISDLSSKRVKLVWAVTDNLGDWAIIRKRLNEELQGKTQRAAAAARRRRVPALCRAAGQRFRPVFRPRTRRQGARGLANRLVAGESRQGDRRRRQTHLEPHFQSLARRHHAGPPRRAQR